jgi:hypothetical protein
MRVFDTFLFGSGETELDLLQMRLEELEAVPDLVHVLVEAPYDHQGQTKPLAYMENMGRFKPWENRIVHVVAEIPGESAINAWHRERVQREWVRTGLNFACAEDGDLVLLCDVDELPSVTAIQKMRKGLPSVVTLLMDMSMFAVDWVIPEQQEIAVAGFWSDMKNFPFGMFRDNSYRKSNPLVPDAGHHFSWLGGPEEIDRKCGYFCHDELRDFMLAGNEQGLWYERGMSWYNTKWTHDGVPPDKNMYQMIPANVSESWPALIREHRCPDVWFRPKD